MFIDLFETPNSLIMPMLEFLASNGLVKGSVIFEPAVGNGAISCEFEKQGFEVIKHDLYTTEVKQDYLDVSTHPPAYTITVTNPPYCLKYEFLSMALATKKPFAFLIPLASIATKKWYQITKGKLFYFQVLSGNPMFLHDGKLVNTGEVLWVYGNTEIIENKIFHSIINSEQDDISIYSFKKEKIVLYDNDDWGVKGGKDEEEEEDEEDKEDEDL
jgi:hypothetical protein